MWGWCSGLREKAEREDGAGAREGSREGDFKI